MCFRSWKQFQRCKTYAKICINLSSLTVFLRKQLHLISKYHFYYESLFFKLVNIYNTDYESQSRVLKFRIVTVVQGCNPNLDRGQVSKIFWIFTSKPKIKVLMCSLGWAAILYFCANIHIAVITTTCTSKYTFVRMFIFSKNDGRLHYIIASQIKLLLDTPERVCGFQWCYLF